MKEWIQLKIDEVLVDDSEGIRRENKRPVSFLTDESTSASSIPDGGQMGIHGAAEWSAVDAFIDFKFILMRRLNSCLTD